LAEDIDDRVFIPAFDRGHAFRDQITVCKLIAVKLFALGEHCVRFRGEGVRKLNEAHTPRAHKECSRQKRYEFK